MAKNYEFLSHGTVTSVGDGGASTIALDCDNSECSTCAVANFCGSNKATRTLTARPMTADYHPAAGDRVAVSGHRYNRWMWWIALAVAPLTAVALGLVIGKLLFDCSDTVAALICIALIILTYPLIRLVPYTPRWRITPL